VYFVYRDKVVSVFVRFSCAASLDDFIKLRVKILMKM
jgi:hypothetical protein